MPRFDAVNQSHSTTDPTIQVESDPTNPLPRGKRVFRLVVVDSDNNVSLPDEVTVYVVDRELPTAILKAPTEVDVGVSFTLDGTLSADPAQGKIVRYIWTRVE